MDLVKSDIDRYFDYLSDKEKELVCMGDMVFEKLPEVIRDFGEALQAGCMSAQNISEPEGGDKNEKEEVSAQGMEMILRDKDKEVVMCEGKGKELVVREEGGEVRIRGGEDQSMMVVGEDGGNEEVNGNRRRGRPKTDLNVWPKWLPWNWIINNVTRTGGRSAGHVDRYYYNPGPGPTYKFRSRKEVLYFLRTRIPPKSYKMARLLQKQPLQLPAIAAGESWAVHNE